VPGLAQQEQQRICGWPGPFALQPSCEHDCGSSPAQRKLIVALYND
jgi:hypothetical protein